MARDKNFKSDAKKKMPQGFLIFLFLIMMLIFAVQAFLSDKKGKIAFSHQVEHLVNLDLLKPEESKKVADNDRLVTFSGKFRDEKTEEGEERFKYLDLLNKNHEFVGEESRLEKELVGMRQGVNDSAVWFLEITGEPIPKSGYVVISSIHDTPNMTNSIVIKSIVHEGIINLKEVEAQIVKAGANPSPEMIESLNKEIAFLLQLFKSPNLGIGSDQLKQKLKNCENSFASISSSFSSEEKLAKFKEIVSSLQSIATSLNEERDGVRLIALRTIRNYVETVDQYNNARQELEKNELLLNKARQRVAKVTWFFNNKELSSKALEKQDVEVFGHFFLQAKKEWENFSVNRGLTFKVPAQPRNAVLDKTFRSEEPSPNYFSYLLTLLPIILIAFVLFFVFSKQMKGVGSSAMNFGKSPAKLLTKETNKFTFNDVAGADEAKEELAEIVDFLKDPQKFTALGARIPKGILLVGAPGTGKTLIAKAVAGEADRPFFSISGSDFVEMFVGVGASRIRDLFDQAKKNAPCIIFMDEIDAVGRHRGAGIGGGHDEREQTLNQLLVEMDGFDTKEGVILMAATNRPDILDRALLRPGRFDRRVTLELPDVKGRFEILKVHARKVKIDTSVDLMEIARNTPGSSGADLENILNEAALMAVRRGRSAVTSQETREACDKVRFGKERRSLEMDANEKRTTAFHEAGHAIVGLNVKKADPVDKVTIIPRGFSLGATHFMPKKNRLNYWRSEVLDMLAIAMGGRTAEELFMQDLSSGAQQDINEATKLARTMVCEWGMSEDLGTVTYDERQDGGQYLGLYGYHERAYSEETAKQIDKEVKKIIDEAHSRAKDIIGNNRDKLQLMADMLIEFETLDAQDIKEIMDGSWSIDKKKERIKEAESLQKKTPPPPPLVKDKAMKNSQINPQQA